MKKFQGFSDTETFTRLPDLFFQQLLPEIESVAELKVVLYMLWRVEHLEGPFRGLEEADLTAGGPGLPAEEIGAGLEQAVRRGVLLRAEHDARAFYFLNSPRGRAAANAFLRGEREPEGAAPPPFERPNIFRLYEENIGPLTPLIADALTDAEHTYSAEWVADTIDLAVRNNKRSWRYCEAILKRWKEEGRGEKQNRRDPKEDRDKYTGGEFADFVEH